MKATSEELKTLKPLVVAVVGPTNEGKTSLLRTLTNDPDFGHVNAYTGTTARAEIQKVFYRGVAEILRLIDTPGFQTSSEILELTLNLPEVIERGGEFDLSDVMRAIPQTDEDYRHDLRAWREVERCDVVVLVASAAEDPSQSAHKNTLRLLKNIGKPVVVAFNNVREETEPTSTGAPDFRAAWDETLRKNSFFLVQQYDAHRRSFANEVELFEKLAALARDPLTQRVLRLEIAERKAQERRRATRSREIIAELLLDVAAYRETATNVEQKDWRDVKDRLEEKFKETVVKREHDAQLQLLETWEFKIGVLNREMLDVADASDEKNCLFGKEAPRHLGVGGGAGVALGAALGLALDAATAGITLGAGLTLGIFLGGLLGSGGAMAYNAKYDAKGKRLVVRAQREVVDVLLSRGLELTRQLQTRGKALEDSVQALVSSQPKPRKISSVSNALDAFSSREDFSTLNESVSVFASKDWRRLPGISSLAKDRKTRAEAVAILADALKEALPDED